VAAVHTGTAYLLRQTDSVLSSETRVALGP